MSRLELPLKTLADHEITHTKTERARMPFLLIAVLIVAAIANPLAGARAAPPGELSRHAGAQAVPIAPAGGIGALRRAADPDHGQVTRPPTRHVGVIPAAASDAPGVVAEDTASPPRPENDILIPLAPKTRESADTFGPEGAMPSSDEQRARGRSTWIATTVGALGIALGAFLLLAWMVRRSVPAAMRPLPSDVVEVLGRAPLIGRQQLHMLRLCQQAGVDLDDTVRRDHHAGRNRGYGRSKTASLLSAGDTTRRAAARVFVACCSSLARNPTTRGLAKPAAHARRRHSHTPHASHRKRGRRDQVSLRLCEAPLP